MKIKNISLMLFFVMYSVVVSAQLPHQTEKNKNAEESLKKLALNFPELDQKVQLSMSGASIQEFLRTLAQTSNLNINVDPQLNFKISNNFRNESALHILLFLIKEYDLDIKITGSIVSINKYIAPIVKAPVKEIRVSFNSSNENLSFDLFNDSLALVAKKISQISQKNVIVPNNLISKKITAQIASAPFETALEKMAFANDLKFFKTQDDVYIFQPLLDGEELFINADNEASVKRVNKIQPNLANSSFGISSRLNTEGKKTLSVDATNIPILDIIKTTSAELGINYFLYSDIKGSVTTRINHVLFEDFLNSLFQGTEYTFNNVSGVYFIGDRKLEGLRSNKIIQLQHRSLDTLVSMIPTEWKKGVEIKEFREQNTLLLSGSAPQIREIEGFIKQLDRVVPMVLIEVTLVDIRKSKVVRTGISAGLADSVKTGGTILPGVDYTLGANSINNLLNRLGTNNSTNLGRVAPNFYIKLSALENNSNVEIRSVPKLSTLNGHTANLSIGSSRYYSQKTQNVIPSLNAQLVVTEQFTEVNANLEVNIKPIVSGDDQVTLDISVNISDFIGNPPLNAPPPKSTSQFSSIIRAKNEDMIVLGGLERTESLESGSGIPLLSRIPVLKWLFSAREKSNGKVVTLVFIKPTILF